MQNLTPREIVQALDRHIVGQAAAKRAVSVAIRNRWRRRQLDKDMAGEVYPKNIIMVGPTGVGKTEIARRLASLTGAPFIKVEASKFTEVGYHGRDVESMIRDLLDQALAMVRKHHAEKVKGKAEKNANNRLLQLLLPSEHATSEMPAKQVLSSGTGQFVSSDESGERKERIREKLRHELDAGTLDDREVEIHQRSKPAASIMFANMGMDQMDPQLSNMLDKLMPEDRQRRRVTVREARRIFTEEETDKLIDQDQMTRDAIELTENDGMIFLDEIDKIASPSGKGQSGGGGGSPDVSRQGVQRDLLPIVEGSTVTTRHGIVRTDHILFIAAGAFHVASVSDLMPELQGRFPIRVELSPLSRDDFKRILTEPRGALTRQQEALLAVEGLTIQFDESAIHAIADLAARANANLENIGARRLMTIVEKVFDQINFEAPDMVSRGETKVDITGTFVREQVEEILQDKDLSKFVL